MVRRCKPTSGTCSNASASSRGTYCVDILRQTYAVRKAIEKLEALILENHLHGCVPEGIKSGREEAVIDELVQLYTLAGNR